MCTCPARGPVQSSVHFATVKTVATVLRTASQLAGLTETRDAIRSRWSRPASIAVRHEAASDSSSRSTVRLLESRRRRCDPLQVGEEGAHGRPGPERRKFESLWSPRDHGSRGPEASATTTVPDPLHFEREITLDLVLPVPGSRPRASPRRGEALPVRRPMTRTPPSMVVISITTARSVLHVSITTLEDSSTSTGRPLLSVDLSHVSRHRRTRRSRVSISRRHASISRRRAIRAARAAAQALWSAVASSESSGLARLESDRHRPNPHPSIRIAQQPPPDPRPLDRGRRREHATGGPRSFVPRGRGRRGRPGERDRPEQLRAIDHTAATRRGRSRRSLHRCSRSPLHPASSGTHRLEFGRRRSRNGLEQASTSPRSFTAMPTPTNLPSPSRTLHRQYRLAQAAASVGRSSTSKVRARTRHSSPDTAARSPRSATRPRAGQGSRPAIEIGADPRPGLIAVSGTGTTPGVSTPRSTDSTTGTWPPHDPRSSSSRSPCRLVCSASSGKA